MRRSFLITAIVLGLLASTPPAMAADDLWGVSARGGWFGVPNLLLDRFLEKHPGVSGSIVGGELRYYGDGGPDGVFSVGLGFDYASCSADGLWQKDPGDPTGHGSGSVTLMAGTLTAYWDIAPQATVHPYLGLGGGYGQAKGHYNDGSKRVDFQDGIPVVHIPVGLAIRPSRDFSLRIEGRLIDGFSLGGALFFNF